MIKFIRPYTPDLVGWLRDFGQGAANYDANGHFARIQPIFNAYSFTDNPAAASSSPIPPSAAPRRPADRPGAALPGRGLAGAGRRLGALPRHRRHPGLRPEPRAPRPMKRLLAIASVLLAAAALVVFGTGAGDDGGGYRVRAIFRTRSR